MREPLIPLLAYSLAFWVGVLGYGPRRDLARYVVGLFAGASLAHLGWVLLYLEAVRASSWSLLWPWGGYSVLFLPAGLLLAAPRGRDVARRREFLAAAFRSLPLALALARAGCLAVGCCYGVATSLPWGILVAGSATPRHPTPLYEIGGLLLLHVLLRRLPAALVAPAFLIGFGAIRLSVEPIRAAPSLGSPLVPAALLAAAWILAAMPLLRAPACRDAPLR